LANDDWRLPIEELTIVGFKIDGSTMVDRNRRSALRRSTIANRKSVDRQSPIGTRQCGGGGVSQCD